MCCGVPTSTVIGTSMVLTLVTMVFATMLHAVTNHLVDAVLALILMIGGVTGAQFGARAGQKIRGEHLRLLLGLLVLAGRHPFCGRAGDPAAGPVQHPRNRRSAAMRLCAPLAIAGLVAAGLAAVPARGGAADRVGLQPPCHGDAELFRRRARAVRLGREGRQDAAQSRQLRSRGHRVGPARRHGDTAQGAQIRHLDQHRLAAIPAGAGLSRAVLQSPVRPDRRTGGAAAAAARAQQRYAGAAGRAGLCRRGAERSVPQRLRPAAIRARPVPRGRPRQ